MNHINKHTVNKPTFKCKNYFDTNVCFQIDEAQLNSKVLDEKSKLALINECFQLCEKYNKLFSPTCTTSELWKINHNKNDTTQISFETYECLRIALHYAEISQGVVDPSMGTITKMWNFHNKENPEIPNIDKIEAALKHVNYKNIKLAEATGTNQKPIYSVTLKDPDMAIDLGWIAKGYIADKIKEYLCNRGVTRGFVNLGGNFVAINKNSCNGYVVGIQRPFSTSGEAIATVDLNNKSMVTSGNYERYFKHEDKLYHHILNSKTGHPIENDLLGITIISEKSVDGDALATLCYCLGLNAAVKFLADFEDVQAFFIDKNNSLFTKDGEVCYNNDDFEKGRSQMKLTEKEIQGLKDEINDINSRLSKLSKEDLDKVFGGDAIDDVSGATVSSNAVISAVEKP